MSVLPILKKEQFLQDCRIWKLDPKISKETMIEQFINREEGKKLVVDAVLLKKETLIEDCQICDTDIVIVEYKLEG